MAFESPVAHRRDRPGHALQYSIRLGISAKGMPETSPRLLAACVFASGLLESAQHDPEGRFYPVDRRTLPYRY